MSINVTVSGNPVSIKRGKMVTAGPDHSKQEFDKRRRMRLEQVRQQSKDIAEDVRKKVRKEKKKQLSHVEKEGADKLKEWQNRKLLELQQQYCECLQDIGLGHAQAEVENTQDESVDVRKQELKEKAKERGEKAAQKLQVEKNRENLKKAIPLQHKRFVRDVEDTRSAMVSKLTPHKKKKKKTSSANINITNVVSDSDSELEETVPASFDVSSAESSRSPSRLSSPGRSKSPSSFTRTTASSVSRKSNSPKRNKAINVTVAPSKVVKRSRSRSRSGSPKKTKPALKSISEVPSIRDKFPNFPQDTRISDRIKNRHLPPEETFANFHCKRQPIVVNVPCPRANPSELNNTDISVPPEAELTNFHYTKRPDVQSKYHSRANASEVNKTSGYFNPQAQSSKTDCRCQNDNVPPSASHLNQDKLPPSVCTRKTSIADKPPLKMDEIPTKPTVNARNVRHEPSEVELNTVQYYDHSNRYSKEYVCDNSHVQKIPESSIQICPSPCGEKEFYDKMYKRDREAQIRGQKALEKERIHKDYKELMQKLPVLQRQERIASINADKPIFHMSDDRLRQYELKKQNRMDQAYERLFPDTPMITIPPKNHRIETEPFNVVDLRGDNRTLNLAAWDVDSNKNLENDGADKSDKADDEKREKLKVLLAKLKMQKEMLLREVDELPKDSNLNNLIEELDRLNREESKEKLNKDSFGASTSKDICNCPKTAPCCCNHLAKTLKKPDKKLNQKRPRQKVLSTSNSSSSPSPRKKHRHRRRTLILQNTSTQTTPKVNSELNAPCEISGTNDVPPKPMHKRPQSKSPKRKTSNEKITRSTSPIRLKSRATSPIDDNKSKRSKSPMQVSAASVDKSKLKRPKSPTKEKPKKDDGKGSRPCDCKESNQGEVCEILIKIKDDDAPPEITVKSPTKKKKFVIVKTDMPKSKEEPRKPEKVKQKLIRKISEEPPKTSWREQFSRNDSAGTSTSTSYFSPPDFLTSGEFVRPRAESTSNQIKSHLSHLLTNRSKQSNFDASQKNLDPRLLRYIKKLLMMSRASIDDLGVSTVSDISTPSSSIMDTDKNNPLHQLKNVIKFFNLNPDDLKRCLNYSDDTTDTSLQRNTTSSTSGYDASKSRNQTDPSHSQLDSIPSPNVPTDAYGGDTYPQAVTKYTKIAEMCHKRISDLTAMIEKVRVEKQQIMSPNQSDKENTTSYFNLPSNLGVQSVDTNDFNSKSDDSDAKGKKLHDNISVSSNTEQLELNRKLIEIDYSTKLQKMTPAEMKIQYKHRMDALNDQCKEDELSLEFVERYKALLRFDDVSSNEDIPIPKKSSVVESYNEIDKLVLSEETANAALKSPDLGKKDVPFVPLLIDIPRLPKLSSAVDSNQVNNQVDNSRHRKPPLAKGLNAAKKFNDQIKTTPHELSTILEVDSQQSTRLRQSNSPEIISRRTSPTKAFTQMKPLVVVPPDQNSVWTSQPNESKISDESMPDIVSELPGDKTNESNGITTAAKQPKESNNKDEGDIIIDEKTNDSPMQQVYNLSKILAEQSSDTSSDKSELENVEMMLRSMGMGWAIATLRKTQQALDRPSSSASSLEKSGKSHRVQLSDNSSGTDVTLRDFLTKKVLNASTSTSKSDVSPFIREFDDISTIQGSGLSSENKNHRTSTPIQTTKSSEKSKNDSHKLVTPESDQSSKVQFLTMPEDTTSSLGSQILDE